MRTGAIERLSYCRAAATVTLTKIIFSRRQVRDIAPRAQLPLILLNFNLVYAGIEQLPGTRRIKCGICSNPVHGVKHAAMCHDEDLA